MRGKIAILDEIKVPFIELAPTEDGLNQYIYKLKSYKGIQFIDDDAILLQSLFEDNKAELIDSFKSRMENCIVDDAITKAHLEWQVSKENLLLEHLIREVNTSIGHISPSDTMEIMNAKSVIIHPVSQYDLEGIAKGNWAKLESVDCQKYNDKYFVILNKKHQFLSSLGMLKSIYEKLSSSGLLKGLIADDENGTYTKDKLVGVSLTLPVANKSKPVQCNSLLYKYADNKCEMVDVYEFGSKKSKATDIWYMTVNDGIFVDSYEWQLKNIIYNLMKHYEIEVHLTSLSQNKQKVNAIKINGLCDVDSIKDTLLGFFQGVIRMLKQDKLVN